MESRSREVSFLWLNLVFHRHAGLAGHVQRAGSVSALALRGGAGLQLHQPLLPGTRGPPVRAAAGPLRARPARVSALHAALSRHTVEEKHDVFTVTFMTLNLLLSIVVTDTRYALCKFHSLGYVRRVVHEG